MLDNIDWNIYCICFISLIIFLFFIYPFLNNNREDFSDKPLSIKPVDDIDNVASYIKNKEDKWKTYEIKKEKNYYNLYKNSKKPLLSAKVTTEKNKKRIKVFKNIEPTNTDAIETENPSEYSGENNGRRNFIKIKHGRERMNINNQQLHIKVLGGMEAKESLPYPWYYTAPLVYMDNGRHVALVDYPGNKKDIYKKNLDVEISLPDEQKDNLPLFLQSYAILHENISKKLL
jgi:hypothetical protein